LNNYIIHYYQGLFSHTEYDYLSLDESVTTDIQQVSPEENEYLMAVFMEKEVKYAIFQMKHNKASGPNDFPTEFYQIFWKIIKGDLMALFNDFHEGKLPLLA
jgi:hypothetical protein